MSMNHVSLLGRLTKAPDARRTSEGTAVTSFTLAVDRDYQKDTVDFIDCVAWRQTAEFAAKYLDKGRAVAVTGQLQIREWKDKDGKNVLHGQTGTKLANVGKLTIKADGTLTMELLPVSEKVLIRCVIWRR